MTLVLMTLQTTGSDIGLPARLAPQGAEASSLLGFILCWLFVCVMIIWPASLWAKAWWTGKRIDAPHDEQR